MASGSTKAVYAAIAGNSVLMVSKFVAFAMTGAGTMLSEGIHSLADVGNQVLLAVGIRQSHKAADALHPYGYAREQFVWALISAVGIFFLGCGVTVYHGIHSLLHPSPMQQPMVVVAVLTFAFLVEGWTFLVALKIVHAAAKSADQGFWAYVARGSDPMGVAVLLEDGAAVLGLLIATTAFGLVSLTGDPLWDGVGSILIGLLLGCVAVFLIYKNREALLGMSIESEKQKALVEALRADPVVSTVRDVKATILGAASVRFKAEVDFDGTVVSKRALQTADLTAMWNGLHSEEDLEALLIAYGERVMVALGEEVDRLEARLQEVSPDIQHVDLEAD